MFTILGAIIGAIAWGFWGFVLGIIIGIQIDKRMPGLLLKGLTKTLIKHQQRIQKVFFESTFLVMGHLAKADGRVSEAEIQLARQVMQRMRLSESATREAMGLFNRGKSPEFNLETQLQLLHSAASRQRNLLQMFLEIQLGAAFADGELHDAEQQVLLHICDVLGFSRYDFERLVAMIRAEMHSHQAGRAQGMSLDDAYAILSIDQSASDAEVKKAYRRLMSQHHPDKLAAKGLPKEMMELAEEKTHEIRTAYEQIREARGFK